MAGEARLQAHLVRELALDRVLAPDYSLLGLAEPPEEAVQESGWEFYLFSEEIRLLTVQIMRARPELRGAWGTTAPGRDYFQP